MSKIPKIIHCCWFGGNPYPDLIKKCMDSWHRVLPEYEIKIWNENNFDVNCNQYVKEAFEAKKWAFITDYVRLYALYNYGGIYLDTDVEVMKPIDRFLDNDAFSGFEAIDTVPTAIMGCVKGQKFMGKLLHYYDDKHFIKEDGSYDMTANTVTITKMCLDAGLVLNNKEQTIEGFRLYPAIYFCPNNLGRVFNKPSRKSYTIHHSAGSWSEDQKVKRDFKRRMRVYISGRLRRIIGTDGVKSIKRKLGMK